MPDEQRISTAGLRRSIRARAAFFVFLVVGMFLPAGDTGWPKKWPFVMVFFALTVPSVVYLRRASPDN